MIRFSSNAKIYFLIKIALFYFIFAFNSYSDNSIVTLGSDKAPVKIKVYSSLTCPHCASFHINIIPEIKKEYIEKGKVQLIFIDFPLDQMAFNASKLLYCVDKKKQISYLDTIYETQNKWTVGTNLEDVNNNLKKIVKNLGISSSQFDTCLVDDVISDKILNLRIEAHKEYSIDSTPTIVINEKKLKGSASLNNIIKRIEKII